MTHLLGCHWLREHPDQFDLPHIEAMQYRSIKLFKPAWDNAGFSRELLAVLPDDAYILARDHELSEQKEDMWRDADAAGKNHADQWIDKVRSGVYTLPLDRTFFLGINEPDATNGDRDAIDRYTAAFLERLQANGLRGGAFNFSTGHPRTVDGTPNTPADYSVFERSHQAIVAGHHIGVLHIYGTGAVPCAPGNYDRLQACDWQDVEWVVGEFGIDEHVIGGGVHAGFHQYFDGRLPDYCAWLDTAIMGINDPRIHSYQVFTYDFSHPWESFDTRPIRAALENYPWQHTRPVKPTLPYTTHIPVVGTGKPQPPTAIEPTPQPIDTPTATIDAPAGANVRSGPGLEFPIMGVEPYGDTLAVIGRNAEGDWWQVDLPHTQGWVYGMVVKTHNVADVPVVEVENPPPPDAPSEQDKWPRCRDFVKRWEGDFQDLEWDAGNWTGCEVGVGEKKGTNFGISACAYPHLDIRNLTEAQADEIFYRDYYVRSGADKQPWPMCLLVYNAAVNFHPTTAQKWAIESRGNALRFVALYLRGYRNSDAWPHAHDAWVNRVIDVAMEASA